jgi:hypothetical protein
MTQPRAADAALRTAWLLEAEQGEGVVDGDRSEVRVDLVPLSFGVVDLVEELPALVRLLGIALVELVMIVHRDLRDTIQLLVEGRKLTRL